MKHWVVKRWQEAMALQSRGPRYLGVLYHGPNWVKEIGRALTFETREMAMGAARIWDRSRVVEVVDGIDGDEIEVRTSLRRAKNKKGKHNG